MYIEPNSVIKIMKNVPLDNTYSHTIYFESLSSQLSYFSSPTVVKYTLTTQSYQRVVRGRMRIEIKADDLYDCNYLAFQNTNFGNKWFYAFITAVEYVNNSTSEIAFEIDVMQTYHFDYEIKDCFVEREHAMDDTIGANTLKEPVEIGDADVYGFDQYYFNEWDVIIITSSGTITKLLWTFKEMIIEKIYGRLQSIYDDLDSGNLKSVVGIFKDLVGDIKDWITSTFGLAHGTGTYVEGKYIGGNLYHRYLDPFDINGSLNDIYHFLNDYILSCGDNVSAMYMCPHEFTAYLDNNDLHRPIDVDIDETMLQPAEHFWYIGKDEYYTPKNNKLYTSPYTYFRMTNNQGSSVDLAFEKMREEDKNLKIYYSWTGSAEATLQLERYGREPSGGASRPTAITISNFPTCSWNEGSVGTILRDVVKGMSSNIVGTMTSINMPYTFSSNEKLQDRRYTNNMVDFQNQKVGEGYGLINSIIGSPSRLMGGTGSGNVDIANDRLGFEFYNMAITGEQAEVIDNFFEHYGYSTLLNKVPNRNGRPHWNYVKTRDCYIVANAPSESVRKICGIYDNGITFWKNPSEVGNYNLDNH